MAVSVYTTYEALLEVPDLPFDTVVGRFRMCLAGGEEILSVACSCYSPDPPFHSTGASEGTEGVQVTAGEDAYIDVALVE